MNHNLPYDKTNREPICYYGCDLSGSTHRETDASEISDTSRNKGSFDSPVETYYDMFDHCIEPDAVLKEAILELKSRRSNVIEMEARPQGDASPSLLPIKFHRSWEDGA